VSGVKAAVAVTLALGGAGVVAGASGAADGPSASAAATKNVKVADDFYEPKRLTVPKGTTIKWKWSRLNERPHNVYLYERPKGAPRFNSDMVITDFTYQRTLKTPGVYKVLCVVHEGMNMRITVTKPKPKKR
jgi:plastocyanin